MVHSTPHHRPGDTNASPSNTPNTDGVTSTPSLLPAFEPLSSSPVGPSRASLKRKLQLHFGGDGHDDGDRHEDAARLPPTQGRGVHQAHYPTPIPTSSTGVLPSSPPPPSTTTKVTATATATATDTATDMDTTVGCRQPLARTISTLSERSPLRSLPTLFIPASGEPLLLGRSSISADFKLPSNRSISRVHIQAVYTASDVLHPPAGLVEVQCLGWNGAKVHCRGEVHELAKGDRFVSDKPQAQIIVDVQDTRVMLAWPREEQPPQASPTEPSPGFTRVASLPRSPTSPHKYRTLSVHQMASSPPPFLLAFPRSPMSPTPAVIASSIMSSTFSTNATDEVRVYEDHGSDPEYLATTSSVRAASTTKPSQESRTSAVAEEPEFSEHDEENDPIIHSFGPFGENILERLQSFQPTSPERPRKRRQLTAASASVAVGDDKSPGHGSGPVPHASPVKNHVINQLAFSRIHSLPLSTIHGHLPAELRGDAASDASPDWSPAALQDLLHSIPCVGAIPRSGTDAAGKPLESEFYYVPERDEDTGRRDAVMGSLGRTGLRMARRVHKVRFPPPPPPLFPIPSPSNVTGAPTQQYYWKRPRH